MNLIKTLQDKLKKWEDGKPELPHTVSSEGAYFRVGGTDSGLIIRIEDDRKAIHLSINQGEVLYKFLKKLYDEEREIMIEWKEKRREELGIAWENYCIEKEKRQNDGKAIDIATLHFLDKLLSQEKEMLRKFAIEIFDNNDDVMIHKHILNDRINKILKSKNIEEI